jgi:hypothetical protein
MSLFLQAERLIIRNWNLPEDAEFAWQIYGDSEVMRREFDRTPNHRFSEDTERS